MQPPMGNESTRMEGDAMYLPPSTPLPKHPYARRRSSPSSPPPPFVSPTTTTIEARCCSPPARPFMAPRLATPPPSPPTPFMMPDDARRLVGCLPGYGLFPSVSVANFKKYLDIALSVGLTVVVVESAVTSIYICYAEDPLLIQRWDPEFFEQMSGTTPATAVLKRTRPPNPERSA